MVLIGFWLIFWGISHNRRKNNNEIIRRLIKRKKTEGSSEMKELAERFVDKECVIYSFNDNHQFVGIIKEVTDGAILVEKDGKLEAINLDFVIRIREYPVNKKGKKVSVVID